MPGRYFYNRLPDWGGAPVGLDGFRQLAAQTFREVLRDVLSRGPAGQKPSVYTGKPGAGARAQRRWVQVAALLSAGRVQSIAAL